MYAPSTDFCLLPGCDRPAYSRGICDACYLTALKMVRQGRTTWQELEERGLCNPPKGSRVLSNPLAVALRDSREQDEPTSPQKELFEGAVTKSRDKKPRASRAKAKATKAAPGGAKK